MKHWRRALLTLTLTAALPLAAAAGEATPKAGEKSGEQAEEMAREAERLAREAIERMLGALQMVIESVPQYHAPEVLENGDIIIRRKHPQDDEEPRRLGDVDETRT